MAKDWRTLKLEILAETKQFVTDMKKGEDTVESFGDKATKMGKVAAAAFAAAAAAAAAYAGKLAIEGVKAAIEDEAAISCVQHFKDWQQPQDQSPNLKSY